MPQPSCLPCCSSFILALFALERELVSTRGPTLSSTPAVCLNELSPKPPYDSVDKFVELYNNSATELYT